jgi:O-antigen ligase
VWTLPLAAIVVLTEVAPGELDQPIPPQIFENLIVGPVLVVCAAAAMLAQRDDLLRLLRRPPVVWLTTLILLGLVLAPLSGAPSRSLTLSLAALCILVIVSASVQRDGWEATASGLALGLILLGLGSVAWELVGPGTQAAAGGTLDTGFGGVPRRAGLSSNPNQLGRVGAVAVALGIGVLGRPGLRATALGTAAAGVAMLLLSQSRTAFLAAGIAVLAAFVRQGRRFLAMALVCLAVVLPVAAFALGTLDSSALTREGAGSEELTSLTGRTDAWRAAWKLALERPVDGHGAFAAEPALRVPVERGEIPFDAEDAHSLPLNTFLTQGILGVAVLAAGTRSAWRAARRHRHAGADEAMVALGIIALTETIFWKPNSALAMIAFGLVVLATASTAPMADRARRLVPSS